MWRIDYDPLKCKMIIVVVKLLRIHFFGNKLLMMMSFFNISFYLGAGKVSSAYLASQKMILFSLLR